MQDDQIKSPKHILTWQEKEKWWRDGFLGPYEGVTPLDMAKVRRRIIERVVNGPPPPGREQDPYYCRHLDDPVIMGLCSLPAVLDRVAALYGSDLILWMSELINKRPGSGPIHWHQDLGTSLDPMVSITVWLAIDHTTTENGCVQVIPAVGNRTLLQIQTTQGPVVDLSQCQSLPEAVSMQLKPGEFFLFKETTVHGSPANRTGGDRLGFTFRITVPIVRVKGDTRMFAGYRLKVLRGHDAMGFNPHLF